MIEATFAASSATDDASHSHTVTVISATELSGSETVELRISHLHHDQNPHEIAVKLDDPDTIELIAWSLRSAAARLRDATAGARTRKTPHDKPCGGCGA